MTGLRTLAELLAFIEPGGSVTRALELWAEARGLEPRVKAHVASRQGDLPGDVARRLKARASDISFRRVELSIEGITLVRASNWFLPGAVSPAFRERLATTDEPFGGIIAELSPARETLSIAADADAAVPLAVRALMRLGDRVIAEVHEDFTPAALTDAPEVR